MEDGWNAALCILCFIAGFIVCIAIIPDLREVAVKTGAFTYGGAIYRVTPGEFK